MRLIHAEDFTLKDFSSAADTPPYAILSHTWLEDDVEVTFQDIQNLERARKKAGFSKIEWTCLQAKADGLDWAWVDTCCIDKSSSHELSEAINSMYRWYMNAKLCYVYLIDVPWNCPPFDDEYVHPSNLRFIEAFEESRWFQRGWTLQELIAPRHLIFFGQAWNPIAALSDVVQRVSGITGIQADVLTHSQALPDLSIARRLSWAAKRRTKRVEDEAYSLLGILNVNMPLLYGEGSEAFIRLQMALIEKFTDQSIFAWDSPPDFVNSRELLLAPSSRCFANAGSIRRRRGTASESAFSIRNNGLEITLPVLRRQLGDDPANSRILLGILDCQYEGSPNVLALVLQQHPFSAQNGTRAIEAYVSGFEHRKGEMKQYTRLLSIERSELNHATPKLLTITKDLRSRTYIQEFNDNEPSWFPIRFLGEETGASLTLQGVYPEECWSGDTSRTLRLRPPYTTHGGVVVKISKRTSVLILFGVPHGSVRKIFDIQFINPVCPIRPHLRSLMLPAGTPGKEMVRLEVNQRQCVVAQLFLGALAVSLEPIDNRIASPSSPPMSPTLTRVSMSDSSRRDSFLEGSRSESSRSSESRAIIHWTSQCDNCQYLKREEEKRKRNAEAATAEQRANTEKKEKRDKQFKTARRVGAGLSIGSVLADMAEFDFF